MSNTDDGLNKWATAIENDTGVDISIADMDDLAKIIAQSNQTAIREFAEKLIGEDEGYADYVEPHSYSGHPEPSLAHAKEIELMARNKLREEQRQALAKQGDKNE